MTAEPTTDNANMLDEAIAHYEAIAKDERLYSNPEGFTSVLYRHIARAEEYEQLACWLKQYKAIREIVHEWSCDYGAVAPDHTEKDKEYYFNKILDTFKP